MSKELAIMLVLTVAFLWVAGCGQTDDLEPHEIFEESIKAMEKVDNFSITTNIEMDQVMSAQSSGMLMDIEADVILDPLTIHQQQSMMTEGQNQTLATEMYLSEQGMFMYDPEMDQWLTFPQEMFEQMLAMEGMLTNPSQELQNLKEHVHDFTLVEEDDIYRFHLATSGEQFQSLLMENMPPEMVDQQMTDEMLEQIDINRMEYEIEINKETFYQTAMVLTADFKLGKEVDAIPVKQHITATYHSFDGVEEITIPEEVIENAEEFFGDDIDLKDIENINELDSEED